MIDKEMSYKSYLGVHLGLSAGQAGFSFDGFGGRLLTPSLWSSVRSYPSIEERFKQFHGNIIPTPTHLEDIKKKKEIVISKVTPIVQTNN